MGMVSRIPSITPARTPAPNELEYLDVFDFFNVPRLPMAPGDLGQGQSSGNGSGNGGAVGGDLQSAEVSNGANGANEFNITNFMIDANSDWLFKNQS